ncbi:DUF2497 domain-containing protein [Belnapia moabensis]|uniref:DUF2497 domain-containing protein n=1 Tax=Belnapia moabensis TaxID=365533 RepID=UPI000694EAE6|nr:DUF2497 domain-containing protein [Belnapia moabensis]
MAEERPAQPGGAPADPSMEDILASIRRILNEDEPGAASAPAASSSAEPLTLTEEMLVQEPAAAAPAPPPEPGSAPKPEPEALPRPVLAVPPEPEPEPAPEPPPPAEALIAPTVAAAATAAIGTLIRAVSQDRGAAVTRGGPSIEDVVREELRPLLKDWLDQHLPALVERLVRAEIERVVGRALG